MIVLIFSILSVLLLVLGFLYYKRDSIREYLKRPNQIEKMENNTLMVTDSNTVSATSNNTSSQKTGCPDCNCVATDAILNIKDAEIKYLRWMSRLLGVLLRKENALNRVMSEHSPGVFATIPFVEKVEQEQQYVQDFIQKDQGMLDYFQNNFTKYSGVDSKPYVEVL